MHVSAKNLRAILLEIGAQDEGDSVGVGEGVGEGRDAGVGKGIGVGEGIGEGGGEGEGEGVGIGVGEGVNEGVGAGVGEGVGEGVGAGVGACVGEGVGAGVGDAGGVGVSDTCSAEMAQAPRESRANLQSPTQSKLDGPEHWSQPLSHGIHLPRESSRYSFVAQVLFGVMATLLMHTLLASRRTEPAEGAPRYTSCQALLKYTHCIDQTLEHPEHKVGSVTASPSLLVAENPAATEQDVQHHKATQSWFSCGIPSRPRRATGLSPAVFLEHW